MDLNRNILITITVLTGLSCDIVAKAFNISNGRVRGITINTCRRYTPEYFALAGGSIKTKKVYLKELRQYKNRIKSALNKHFKLEE